MLPSPPPNLSLSHSCFARSHHVFPTTVRPTLKVGGDVWCAALLMSAWLLQAPEVVKGLDVLELGSGLGLCGIVAGYLAESVTLTGEALCYCSLLLTYVPCSPDCPSVPDENNE